MAKEEKKHEGEAEHLKGSGKREGERKEGGEKKEKKEGKEAEGGHRLHQMTHTFHKNGGATTVHKYADKKGAAMAEEPEYQHVDMDDLRQHMEDHAAPAMGEPGQEAGEEDEEAGGGAAAGGGAGGGEEDEQE